MGNSLYKIISVTFNISIIKKYVPVFDYVFTTVDHSFTNYKFY